MHCFIGFILFSLYKSLSVEASAASSMEDIYDKTKHLVPGNTRMLSNWSSQGLQDDAVWLVSSAFTIFTMTSGFGLLESGRASVKDEINIMVKNCIDVIFGGLAYWMFGFGLSFGNSNFSNPYVGVGSFFFDPEREEYDADEKIVSS
ncbi:hypothetical protein WR25_02053 [Diploscapter pachys]|uniref:Ammonium transporter AmtB-like domain-containing protein n=1 Tax=Diploscapter pachys TaxID=2018661 RepID=A0A2A2K9R8_9BILA|nr:hypothetical protein WR25_02053 [Diploscapter pachys]